MTCGLDLINRTVNNFSKTVVHNFVSLCATMKYEEERLRRINSIMNEIHQAVDSMYEGLVDDDFESVKSNLRNLSELIDYVCKSISNEV